MVKQDVNCVTKLTRARVALMDLLPFYACLAMRLELVPDPSQPTYATDGKSIFYNPDLVLAGADPEVRSALIHECTHVAMGDPFERGDRDPDLWNQARDYVINGNMQKQGLWIGDDWLYDARFDGMDTYKVYEILRQEKAKQKAKQQKQQGQGQPQPGNGPPGPVGQDKHGKGKGKCCGGIRPFPGNGKEGVATEEDKQAFKLELAVGMAQAVAIAKAAGKMPADLERVVHAIMYPRLPYEDKLRQFVEAHARDDYDWSLPDRSYLQHGLYIPSLHNEVIGEILVVLDTSGSVTDRQVGRFCGDLSLILSDVKPQKVRVVYTDTKVQNVETYEPEDFPIRPRPRGGGGTDFTSVMQYIRTNDFQPKCVIFYTDLETSRWGDDPGVPVLWVKWGASQKVPPFGEVIELNE